MKLQQAFNITQGDVIAFIGAGGKTSALVGMGYELSEAGWRVLATTTTSIPEEQIYLMPYALRYDANPHHVSHALTQHGFVFVYGDIREGQVYGPSVEWTKQILDAVDSDVLLIEADDSNGLPFKAPYSGQPIIPRDASLVIPVVSLSALDQPLDNDHIYNAQAMIEKYGYHPGSAVRSPWIAQVLRDDELGLNGIPENARVVALLNQAPEEGYLRTRARLIARLALKSPRLQGVALGSVRAAKPILEVQRPVGAVILAGGKSERMGVPKVLLPWANDQSIVEHIVDQIIRSRIDYISVVTGHYADSVKALVKPMGVKLAHNRAYRTGGMLSSLKAGLRAMPDHIQAALIVLGDQPRIQPIVVYQILKAFAEGCGDLIAPSYQSVRGYPILVGRRYWRELLNLSRNQTFEDMLAEYSEEISLITVQTDSILYSINTPQDYEAERFRAGLQRHKIHSHQQPDIS